MTLISVGQGTRFLRTPPALDNPVSSGPCWNIAIMFVLEKLEWSGYLMVKKI